MLASYPKIYALGHAALENLFNGPVIVEEKVDGSQFSFGIPLEGGGLVCRSKEANINLDAPDAMFREAVATAKELEPLLHPGMTVRCEYLKKPKHNTLKYNRIPTKHLVVFDVELWDHAGLSQSFIWATPEVKANITASLGLEKVPLLAIGMIKTVEDLRPLLETESFLGGPKVEGVVIKPCQYDLYGRDGKVVMGKFVREEFKEQHRVAWKAANPSGRNILDSLVTALRTDARYQKTVQHLRERGELLDDPKDIGPLLQELIRDLGLEEKESIMQVLYGWAWPHIRRGVIKGFPEWYKRQLLEKQFERQAYDGVHTE